MVACIWRRCGRTEFQSERKIFSTWDFLYFHYISLVKRLKGGVGWTRLITFSKSFLSFLVWQWKSISTPVFNGSATSYSFSVCYMLIRRNRGYQGVSVGQESDFQGGSCSTRNSLSGCQKKETRLSWCELYLEQERAYQGVSVGQEPVYQGVSVGQLPV